VRETTLSKVARARALGIARSTLYYKRKKDIKDWEMKCEIEKVLRKHPGYGHRRIASFLGMKDERPILRVMRKYGIKPYRRRGRKWKKPTKDSVKYENLLLERRPKRMHVVWASDFTHVYWKNKDISVATVMDVYTRIIVGVSVLTTHGTVLVTQALWSALLHNPHPEIFHSDNGSEYNSVAFREILNNLNIRISRSKKGCPWENGYQESFYGKFKVDLGDPNRFETIGELVAEIYHTIHYYNTERIHSAFNMPPKQFAGAEAESTIQVIV
jgi:putative transposase